MDNSLKFYLLAESFGWDCTSKIIDYKNMLLESKNYKLLSNNIKEVKSHLSSQAQALCSAYENLNLEPFSVKDAFIIENTINYMTLHSFPEYYLNPLAIDPNYDGSLTTIGDLVFDLAGKEMTLNEIILDDVVTIEDKKLDVNTQLEYYLTDMNNLVNSSIEIINSRGFSTRPRVKDILLFSLEIVLLAFINIVPIFIFTFPFKEFRSLIYNFQSEYFMSYMIFILPVLVFLHNITFIIFHSYKARISEPYNYAIRFLRKNKSSLFDDIKKEKEKMFAYISEAIENHFVLKNDITDFSKLSSSYIDFKAVLEVSTLKKKTSYIALRTSLYASSTVTTIFAIASFIIFLLSYIFNTLV